MQGMLDRWITKRLEKSINHNPTVALLGARQVGKTTLAKRIAENQDSIYLDLESGVDTIYDYFFEFLVSICLRSNEWR